MIFFGQFSAVIYDLKLAIFPQFSELQRCSQTQMQYRQLTRYTIAARSGRSVYTICICDLMHYASYALQHCIAIS